MLILFFICIVSFSFFVISQESAMNPNYNYTNTNISDAIGRNGKVKSHANISPTFEQCKARYTDTERETDVVLPKKYVKCNTISCISL